MTLTDPTRDDMPALLRAIASRPGPAGPDCLDETTIAALVDGTLDAAGRGAADRHLTGCAVCRSAVAGVTRLVSDAAVAREVAALERRRGVRDWRLPAGLAAAALLVAVLVLPRPANDDPTVHRAPTITAADEPRLYAPIGVVADAARLAWAPVPGAEQYRVTLFDADGRVLFETTLRDTAVALPDSVALMPDRRYLWKVNARIGWDRWSSSPLVEFSVAPVTVR